MVMIVVAISHEVVRSYLVSAAESFTIGFPLLARKMRVTELIAIVYVETAVIVEVLARAFDPVAKSLVLGLR
jgi:hypothetical protein